MNKLIWDIFELRHSLEFTCN